MEDSPDVEGVVERSGSTVDTHLEVEKALKTLGGREKIYRLMIETFISEYEHSDDALEQYLRAGDKEKAHRLVHSMKSAAAQIGARPLANVALLLEKNIAEEGADIQVLLSSFQSHLKPVLLAISAYLKSSSTPEG